MDKSMFRRGKGKHKKTAEDRERGDRRVEGGGRKEREKRGRSEDSEQAAGT